MGLNAYKTRMIPAVVINILTTIGLAMLLINSMIFIGLDFEAAIIIGFVIGFSYFLSPVLGPGPDLGFIVTGLRLQYSSRLTFNPPYQAVAQILGLNRGPAWRGFKFEINPEPRSTRTRLLAMLLALGLPALSIITAPLAYSGADVFKQASAQLEKIYGVTGQEFDSIPSSLVIDNDLATVTIGSHGNAGEIYYEARMKLVNGAWRLERQRRLENKPWPEFSFSSHKTSRNHGKTLEGMAAEKMFAISISMMVVALLAFFFSIFYQIKLNLKRETGTDDQIKMYRRRCALGVAFAFVCCLGFILYLHYSFSSI